MEPAVLDSARRHGVADENMLHAYRNAIDLFDQGAGADMLVGPDRAARLIEVMVVRRSGFVLIVHAYRPARSKFLR